MSNDRTEYVFRLLFILVIFYDLIFGWLLGRFGSKTSSLQLYFRSFDLLQAKRKQTTPKVKEGALKWLLPIVRVPSRSMWLVHYILFFLHCLFSLRFPFVCYADLCMNIWKWYQWPYAVTFKKPLINQVLFFPLERRKKKHSLLLTTLPLSLFLWVRHVETRKKNEKISNGKKNVSHRAECVREHQCHSVYFAHSFN